MSKRHLMRTLAELKRFESPDVMLEQYTTPPEIAADILWEADMRGLIKNAKVADFGSGPGILGIGFLLLGASEVEFIEKDESAIQVLRDNIDHVSEEYEILAHRIRHESITSINETYDIIVQNPPFGTRIKKIDTLFLNRALSSASTVISMHKTTTKDHIIQTATAKGFEVTWSKDYSFTLKKTMPQHVKDLDYIDVTAFIFNRVKG